MQKRFRGNGFEEQNPIDDNIYYNYNIVNNSNVSIPCTFSEQLTAPILENAQDYYLSTIRFVLDGASIPIFTFPSDTTYYVTLQAGAVTSASVAVTYVNFARVNGQNTVYSYKAFLEMINTALGLAFAGAIQAAAPALSVAPFMSYDETSGICSLNGNYDSYLAPNGPANHIRVFFNGRLYNFFNNFLAQFNGEDRADKKDYEILFRDYQQNVYNNIGNTISYLKMSQEYNSLFSWFDITGFVFLSNTIGVKSEYYPIQNTTDTLSNPNATAGIGPASTPMITDFQPYYGINDAAGPRGYLYYTPSSQYRLIDLLSNKLNQMDLTILLRDRVGKKTQYFIPPNQSVQVKIIFAKKALYVQK